MNEEAQVIGLHKPMSNVQMSIQHDPIAFSSISDVSDVFQRLDSTARRH